MERSLLYASSSLLTLPDDEDEIGHIVAVARSRNKYLNVTGTLIATFRNFAQILEGEVNAIDELMESIHRDPRHTDITVLEYGDIEQRRFREWNLSYFGRSTYVARRLEPMLSENPYAIQVSQLVYLMEQFGRGRG